MNRNDEAAQVMGQMINLAIAKAKNKKNITHEMMQKFMNEAFTELSSSFNSRAELSEWHNKAIERSKREVMMKIKKKRESNQ
jgi:hypothetical protein